LSSTTALFDSIAYCRAKDVIYKLLDDGYLEERWARLKKEDPVFIIHYQSSGQ